MNKKPNMMRRAWITLFSALVMLLALELSWKYLPYLPDHFKNTHFIVPENLPKENSPLTPLATPVPVEKAEFNPAVEKTTRLQVRELFADLRSGKRKSLRIAYFADSMTEGDIVTEVLRRDLQRIYGGVGVGYEGIDPHDASFRTSSILRPSRQWVRTDWNDAKTAAGVPLGINGEAYRLDDDSTQGSLELGRGSKSPTPWYRHVTLFWGKGDATLDAGGEHFELKGNSNFNSFTLPIPPQPKLTLTLHASPQIWFYGVSMDSDRGVQLDNYTMRGNKGDGLLKISPEMLRAVQHDLHYDLVLLDFGINAFHVGETDFHWYRVLLRKTCDYLKKNLPGAKIVVLSVMDRAVREDGNMVTDNSLPYVLAAQRAAATDSGLWFVDLYDTMGGSGVMKSWVESPEPLADKDYTHPNRKGGARLAQYIGAALLGEPSPGPEISAPAAGATHAP